MMKRWLILSIALAGTSCASRTSTPPPAQAQNDTGPVISRIVGRHETIIVRAGPNGPTYSAVARDGTVLTKQMTLDELAVNEPAMFGQIRTMQADAVLIADTDR